MGKPPRTRPDVIIHELPPDDPRNINHPMHREKWLDLARVLGRMDARMEYQRALSAAKEIDAMSRKAKSPKDVDENPPHPATLHAIAVRLLAAAASQKGKKSPKDNDENPAKSKAKRGRPPIGKRPKVQVALRLDTWIIDAFRATGPGWQSRINDALLEGSKKLKPRKKSARLSRLDHGDEK